MEPRPQRNRVGALSSAALAASGAAIALDPRRTGEALHLSPTSPRGLAETRAGLGGTYVALGALALLRPRRDTYAAVGATWLGAAALRLAALKLDEPDTDASYWTYLAGELLLGTTALAIGLRRS